MEVPDGGVPQKPKGVHRLEGRGRLGRKVDGAWFVDVADVAASNSLASHAKVLLLLFLAALRDRASEIDLHPAEGEAGEREYRLWSVIDGEHYYASLPVHLAPLWTKELKRLAGLRSWNARLADRLRAAADLIGGRPPGPSSVGARVGTPDWSVEVAARFYRAAADRIDGRPPAPSSGTFRLGTPDWSIEVATAFYPMNDGDRCILTFAPADAARSAEARAIMDRLG
ncbi:hypothetical protein [Paludisphaera soli]|uniref:hypothetical protein n=1 Tax=Paludisphaera soli TaxID=2712865 RepID=UPI0013ED58B8|nr:hypothetical protein [Paludisphaera soli]